MKIGLWKKGLVLGILLLFIGAGILPSFGGTVVEKTTIMDSKSGSYIQDLIDNASEGDTINIPSGIYYENIVINKSISLIGEDKDTTVIDGGGIGTGISVSADWVNISGFTIQYSVGSDTAGIWLLSDYNTIKDNIITKNSNAIVLHEEYSSNTIIGNNISNNYRGIILKGDSNNITGNKISNNNVDGIFLYGSSYNIISVNTITSKNGCGIVLGYSSNNNISNNTISSNNGGGMWLYVSSYNTITANKISLNWDGIELETSSNNTISGNTISSNNGGGMWLFVSSYNTIKGNYIISNENYGIGLSDGVNYNTITGNTISDNKLGISSYGESCNYNIIYHNNFINNEENAQDKNNNTWDDDKYGNYWSDYKEIYPNARKKPFKGIWDTPYNISGGDNVDNYPLIRQWPDSKPRTIPKDRTTFNSLFYWFLERFPLLERLLNLIRVI